MQFWINFSVLIFLLTPAMNVLAVDTLAEKYKVKHLNFPREAMLWAIKNIHDADPNSSPSISVQFLSRDEAVIYSFGIVKTDGEQGIFSYTALDTPGNRGKRGAVVKNLEINKEYEFSYSFMEGGRAKLVVSGEAVNAKVQIMPVAARLIISGMEVSISRP